jgi:hypothetical protein
VILIVILIPDKERPYIKLIIAQERLLSVLFELPPPLLLLLLLKPFRNSMEFCSVAAAATAAAENKPFL